MTGRVEITLEYEISLIGLLGLNPFVPYTNHFSPPFYCILPGIVFGGHVIAIVGFLICHNYGMWACIACSLIALASTSIIQRFLSNVSVCFMTFLT